MIELPRESSPSRPDVPKRMSLEVQRHRSRQQFREMGLYHRDLEVRKDNPAHWPGAPDWLKSNPDQ